VSRPAQGPCRAPPGESTTPNTPHFLGNARPTSTILTGRRDARPYNVRPTWCPIPRPSQDTRQARPLGVPGTPLCWNHHPAPPRSPHNGATGLPREARCGLLSLLRGRPPACHRRGRSPLNQPTSDHADGATLGRWDAKASRRPRRPVLRAASVTASVTASETAPGAASETAPGAASGTSVRDSVRGSVGNQRNAPTATASRRRACELRRGPGPGATHGRPPRGQVRDRFP